MAPRTSMIIIMGSPGSGKSEFIRHLAEPVNYGNQGNRKAITVSPFIENDQVVRLVEFPSFSELGVNPTDAELLVAVAGFLEIQRRRQQAISGVIYMHRTADVGSQSPNADRNLKMLSRILGDNAKMNVIVATDGWAQIRNATHPVLGRLFSFPSQFKRYDGTKLSALYIMHNVLKKTPEPFRIQTELGADEDLASTTAGQELITDIDQFIKDKQLDEQQIRSDIGAARIAKDKDRAATLSAELGALGTVLVRLKKERNKVEAPVDWAQAEMDNTALDTAVKERHDLVTTDWKAKYDESLVKYKQLEAGFPSIPWQKLIAINCKERHESITSSWKVQYEQLLAENNRLKDDGFNLRLRPTHDSGTDPALIAQNPSWLIPFKSNEILWAQPGIKKALWNYVSVGELPVYLARNPAGRIGYIHSQFVTVLAQ